MFKYEKSKYFERYYILELKCSYCMNISRISLNKENVEDKAIFSKIWKVFRKISQKILSHEKNTVKCKLFDKNHKNCCYIKNDRFQFANKEFTLSKFMSSLDFPFDQWEFSEIPRVFRQENGLLCIAHSSPIFIKKRGFGLSRCLEDRFPEINLSNKKIRYTDLFDDRPIHREYIG